MTKEIRRTFYPIVNCADTAASMEWLEKAFGFQPREVHRDEAGNVVHAEMAFDTGILMFGNGEPGKTALYVAVDDPDAHHDRAKAAGAEITAELSDKEYGSRDYAARDLDGNEWYFGTYRP
ncbi:bleomycin resistance protein [Actinomadura sp. GC306]|uniref:VOC family protein n=1 Tax=Actinomadura sp. GC306 TaxID=2530367 RepID=UPI001042E91B|nr:VOC family protein [Actinomadura sp. GC306]TDC64267.1 bleomycin resistance protein [Actinomadura sp. GC306]